MQDKHHQICTIRKIMRSTPAYRCPNVQVSLTSYSNKHGTIGLLSTKPIDRALNSWFHDHDLATKFARIISLVWIDPPLSVDLFIAIRSIRTEDQSPLRALSTYSGRFLHLSFQWWKYLIDLAYSRRDSKPSTTSRSSHLLLGTRKSKSNLTSDATSTLSQGKDIVSHLLICSLYHLSGS